MRKTVLIASSLILSLAAVPAAIAGVEPLAVANLQEFQNVTVYGRAYADLGTVSQVDANAGVIGITGKHGEFAIVSMSLMGRDGKRLRAPTLTTGDIKLASDLNLTHPGATLVAPQVIIIERAPG